MTIKPLPGYVLVEPVQEESKQGSVYLPEQSADKPMKGKVLAVGAVLDMVIADMGIRTCPVKEGQTVFYKQWGGQDIKHDGKEYKLVKFDELLAVYE